MLPFLSALVSRFADSPNKTYSNTYDTTWKVTAPLGWGLEVGVLDLHLVNLAGEIMSVRPLVLSPEGR